MNPASRTRSSIFRFRWQPPANRRQTGVSRFCHFLTPASGREPVLDENERAARSQHAPHLAQRVCGIGDRAQRPGDDDRVDRRVGERNAIGILVEELHRKRRRRRLRSRHREQLGRRIDAVELRDGARVERQVQSGTDADLEHDAARRRHMRRAQARRLLTRHRKIDEPSEARSGRRSSPIFRIKSKIPVTGKVTRKPHSFGLTSNFDALEFPHNPFTTSSTTEVRSMKQRLGLGILLGLAMLFMVPAVSSAQSAIVGLLTDDSGGVLPGVTVEVTSPVMIEGSKTTVTDSQGRYRFEAMRPGTTSSPSHSPASARSCAKAWTFPRTSRRR